MKINKITAQLATTSFFALICLCAVPFAAAQKQPVSRGGANVKKTPASSPNAAAVQKPSSSAAQNTAAAKPRKKVIVVLEFDDATLGDESQKRKMGRQIAILLSNEFSRRGNFTVIERSSIDKVIEDQNRSFGGRYDQSKASKIGKIFNSSTVVVGTITEYTTRKKAMGVGGVYQKFSYSAKIGLAIRLVDVNTGEIQDSVTIEGAAKENSSATVGFGKATEINEELKTSLFTEAANEAIGRGVTQLEKLIEPGSSNAPAANNAANNVATTGGTPANNSTQSNSIKPEKEKKGGFLGTGLFKGKKEDKSGDNSNSNNSKSVQNQSLPAVAPNQPMVANISGTKVWISNLSNTVKIGAELTIVRVVNVIKNPQTGEIIDTEYQEVARIKVTEVKEKVVIGEIVSGKGVKTLDLVRTAN